MGSWNVCSSISNIWQRFCWLPRFGTRSSAAFALTRNRTAEGPAAMPHRSRIDAPSIDIFGRSSAAVFARRQIENERTRANVCFGFSKRNRAAGRPPWVQVGGIRHPPGYGGRGEAAAPDDARQAPLVFGRLERGVPSDCFDGTPAVNKRNSGSPILGPAHSWQNTGRPAGGDL